MDYELHTIKDIFDKVPSDRIGQCIAEMGYAMVAAKSMMEQACLTPVDVIWPDISVWKDDGKGEIGINFTVHGEDTLMVKVQLEPEIKVSVRG